MTGYYQYNNGGYYQKPQQNKSKEIPTCKPCGAMLAFDNNIRSQSGKMIPLDINTHEPHQCKSPNHPYNQRLQQQQQIQQNPLVSRQQQPQQQQQPINPEEIGIAIANMNEALHIINDTLIDIQTHLYSLKPNDVNIKDKEELLRENAELKEALAKIQQNEFKPASQLSSAHPDPTEERNDTTI